MRMIKFEGTAGFDPRRHFLVVLTPEGLERRPLSIPIFEIEGGRNARQVDARSREGRAALLEGRNVLYVGATNIFNTPVRNVPLAEVLEGLLASDVSESLRESIREHICALSPRGTPRSRGAAA
jgi:hypothetical protein